jgi:quercetin 2,3-dioxygenase
MTLRITHRDTLRRHRVTGLRETRLVAARGGASRGLDSLVYLADAEIVPNGRTGPQSHRDVDIVTLVLDGRVAHEGTPGSSTLVEAGSVRVQRAGVGLEHDETNPDSTPVRLLQFRFVSPAPGLAPACEVFTPARGALRVVLGGSEGTFENACTLRAGMLLAGALFEHPGEFVAYVAGGRGTANGSPVAAGHLLEGRDLTLMAEDDLTVALVTRTPPADGAA